MSRTVIFPWHAWTVRATVSRERGGHLVEDIELQIHGGQFLSSDERGMTDEEDVLRDLAVFAYQNRKGDRV